MRLKQQYFCPRDGEIVERKDMVRGYEFAKGQYVLFTEDELKKVDRENVELKRALKKDETVRAHCNKKWKTKYTALKEKYKKL